MKTAIILHGICDANEYYEMDFPSPSNAHWLAWLQQKFLRDGVLCQNPEMPHPYAAVYADWAKVFERMHVDADTTIVGHSAGCGFILKWLSEHPEIKLNKLVLVAPWIDPSRRRGDFLVCTLTEHIAQQAHEMHVFYSTDETVEGVEKTKDMILALNPAAKLHLFTDKEHFCLDEMGTDKFPELWDVCKS